MRFLHAVAHTVALAAVDSVGDHAQQGDFATERFGDGGSAILRTVVNHEDFCIPAGGFQVRSDSLESRRETQFFIERGDDDGEFRRGWAHRSGGFCQAWWPTRGTKRQPSIILVENVPSCFSMSCNS